MRPLPRAVWTNRLKSHPDETGEWLPERCPEATPLTWMEGAWRIPPQVAPGTWPEFLMGMIHCQEEVSIWPVLLLDPRPGEHLLDICAAPGNKTVLAGMLMQDQGCCLANEINWKRFQSLRDVLNRLGLTQVVTTQADGRHLPGRYGFDRVLADVPCSCEGTSRKHSGWIRSTPFNKRIQLSKIQTQLLKRAVELTRPGGVIVYSTCTYAPEENEAVISGIDPEWAVLESLSFPPGFHYDPGLREWKGQVFRRDIGLAARFWPHHNDTGGFFVARLRRL